MSCSNALRKMKLSSFSNLSATSPTSQLIVQSFHCFTYITAHSPTLPLLQLRHNSFSNPSVASPTSQFILQPLFRFSYVTSSSLNSPGEPPMLRRTHVRPSLSNRQNLLSSLKTTESYSTLPSTVSRHHSSHAWRCRGVSDTWQEAQVIYCKPTVTNGPW